MSTKLHIHDSYGLEVFIDTAVDKVCIHYDKDCFEENSNLYREIPIDRLKALNDDLTKFFENKNKFPEVFSCEHQNM